MANKIRGEVEILLSGKRYTLRPTFEAIAEMESRLGNGITWIAKQLADQKAGLKDIAAVIHAGLIGAGEKRLSYEDVGELIMREGLNKFVKPVCDLISSTFEGSETIELEPSKKKEMKTHLTTHAGMTS